MNMNSDVKVQIIQTENKKSLVIR